MAYVEIPISAKPSQQCQVTINGGICLFKLYKRNKDYYFDLIVNKKPICIGQIVKLGIVINQGNNNVFDGKFMLVDMDNKYREEIETSQLGNRYKLICGYNNV